MDPAKLITESFDVGSVVDLSEQVERNYDFKKFYSFADTVIPKARFLLNNHESTSQVDAEEKVMGKAMHIDFAPIKHGLDTLEASSVSSLLSKQRPKLEDSPELFGQEEELMDDLAELDREEASEIIKSVSGNTLDNYRSYPPGSITGSQMFESKKFLASREMVVYTQKNFSKNPETKSNWVYFYGLPYDLEALGYESLKDQLVNSLRRFGHIRKIKFYSFKDFLTLQPKEKEILIPKNIVGAFDPIPETKRDHDLSPELDILQLAYYQQTNPDTSSIIKVNKQSKENEEDHEMVEDESADEEVQNSTRKKTTRKTPMPREAKKLFQAANFIIESVERGRQRRLAKSYVLVEFEDEATKNKVLAEDFRVLGINLADSLCKAEDLDYKRSLVLCNFPYGSDTQQVHIFLNDVLSQQGIELSPFTEDPKINQKMQAILRLNSTEELFRAQQALENSQYLLHQVKTNIIFGNLKKSNTKCYEIVDVQDDNSKIIDRVQNMRQHELEALKEKEELIHSPAIKISDLNSFFNEGKQAEVYSERDEMTRAINYLEDTSRLERENEEVGEDALGHWLPK